MSPFRREFEYFLIMASTLNISEASEQIGVQQSGLSKALKTLEEELQQNLFYRLPRGLKLTPFGEVLRDNLSHTKESWLDSFDLASMRLNEVIGRYSIGCHQSIAMTTLKHFLPSINEKYKSLRVEVLLKRTPEVINDVVEHRLDFGIVVNPTSHPDLIIKSFSSEFVAFWSRNPRNPDRYVLYNPEMMNISKALKRVKHYRLQPIQDYYVIATLMEKSRGLGVIPSRVAKNYEYLHQVGPEIFSAKTCMIYRYDISKTAAFHAIRQEIVEGMEGV